MQLLEKRRFWSKHKTGHIIKRGLTDPSYKDMKSLLPLLSTLVDMTSISSELITKSSRIVLLRKTFCHDLFETLFLKEFASP